MADAIYTNRAQRRQARCWIDGDPVPRELWARTCPKQGDTVNFIQRFEGGGNSQKYIRIIALVAVIAFAIAAPYLLFPAGFAGTTIIGGLTYGTVITAGIALAGSLAVNALIPPPKYNQDRGGGVSLDTSQALLVTGQRNQARPWDVVPRVLGRYRVAPAVAGLPYTESIDGGKANALRVLYCWGIGPINIREQSLRIGQTALDSFDEYIVEHDQGLPRNEQTFTAAEVNTGTDTLEITEHMFLEEEFVWFTTDDTLPAPLLEPFTITMETDVSDTTFRVTKTAHGLVEGQRIVWQKDDIAEDPTGLRTERSLFVRNPTANDFQVSTTKNGLPFQFSDSGLGQATITPLYYTLDKTPSTLQISDTEDEVLLNLTDGGTGTHTIQRWTDPISIYTQDVFEEQLNIELLPSDNNPPWVLRNSQDNADEIAVDIAFPQGPYQINSAGERANLSIQIKIQLAKDGLEKQTFDPADVNTTANTITIVGNTFADGENVNLTSTGDLPDPIALLEDYVIYNKVGDAFQLALPGSPTTPINFTDQGTGEHNIERNDWEAGTTGFDAQSFTVRQPRRYTEGGSYRNDDEPPQTLTYSISYEGRRNWRVVIERNTGELRLLAGSVYYSGVVARSGDADQADQRARGPITQGTNRYPAVPRNYKPICRISRSSESATISVTDERDLDLFAGGAADAVATVTGANQVTVSSGALLERTFTITGREARPTRNTYYFTTRERAKYKVRARRITGENESVNNTWIADAFWSALRTFNYSKPVNVEGVALTALYIKATGQLGGVVDTFNGEIETIAKRWDSVAGEWDFDVTASPADLFRDILQNPTANARPKLDSELDLPALQEFAEIAAGNVQRCNIYVDFKTDVWEILQQICSTAQASPAFLEDKYTVLLDRPIDDPVQQFNMRNMWNFSAEKQFYDLPDAYRARFPNEEKDYTPDEMIVPDTGFTALTAKKFETIQLAGVTSPDAVWAQIRYIIAQTKLRPEVYSWTSDIAALGSNRGDLVEVQFDVPLWGIAAGRVRSIITQDTETTGVLIDETVPLESGKSYGATFQLSDMSSLNSALVNTLDDGQKAEEYTGAADDTIALGDGVALRNGAAQSFQPLVEGILTEATLNLSKQGVPTGNVIVRVATALGTHGSNATPGATLDTAAIIDASTLTAGETTITFTFAGAVNLAKGQTYCLLVEYDGGDATNYVNVHQDTSTPSHPGNAAERTDTGSYVGTWSPTSNDLPFSITLQGEAETKYLQFQVPVPTSSGPQVGDSLAFGEAGKETVQIIIKDVNRAKDLTVNLTGVDYSPEIFDQGKSIRQFSPTDVITATDTLDVNNNYNDHDKIAFATDGALPAPLQEDTVYYVRNRTATAFQVVFDPLDTTPINLTTAGSGLSRVYRVMPTFDSQVTATPDMPAPVIVARSGGGFLIEAPDGSWVAQMVIEVEEIQGLDSDINNFEILWKPSSGVDQNYNTSGPILNATGSLSIRDVVEGEEYQIQARFIRESGARGPLSPIVLHTVVGKEGPPADVTNFQIAVVDSEATLTWDPVPDRDIRDYIVRTGVDYDTGQLVGIVTDPKLVTTPPVSGQTYWIKARDTSLNESVTAASVIFTVVPPAVPVITATFDRALLKLDWTEVPGTYTILSHCVKRGGTTFENATFVATVHGSEFQQTVDWSGTEKWWVCSKDILGNQSGAASIDVSVTPVEAVNLKAKVIDNNVILQWTQIDGTLPLFVYEIKRGPVFETAEEIGEAHGTFQTIFEEAGGTFTYWIQPVDEAGNKGSEISALVTVDEPPDFVLRNRFNSDFVGTDTGRTNVRRFGPGRGTAKTKSGVFTSLVDQNTRFIRLDGDAINGLTDFTYEVNFQLALPRTGWASNAYNTLLSCHTGSAGGDNEIIVFVIHQAANEGTNIYDEIRIFVKGSEVGRWNPVEGIPNLYDDQMHHLAVARNSTTGAVEVILDGVSKGTKTGLTGVLTVDSNGAYIGVEQDGDTPGVFPEAREGFKGFIANPRMWSDIRTVTEVNDNKDTYLVGNEANLVFDLHLLETDGLTASDNSTNDNDANVSQSTMWTGPLNKLLAPVNLTQTYEEHFTEARSDTFDPADVNTTNDDITITGHPYSNDNKVRFSTTGTLPAPLNSTTTYYIVGATANTIQVSLTQAGAAVVLTTQGTGTHTLTQRFESPQDQIDAGLPVWSASFLPSSGSFEEYYDIGVEVGSTTIVLDLQTVAIQGTVDIDPEIYVRRLITDSWTQVNDPGAFRAVANAFRYVRVVLNFNPQNPGDQLEVTQLLTTAKIKQKTDQGAVNVSSNPTTVTFNVAFADVDSIQVTPKLPTTGQRIALYDFTDTPNPTSFDIYLYDENFVAATGEVSWVVRGV